MAIQMKKFATDQITAALATYYEAGVGTTSRIDAFTITNTSASAVAFDLHLVPDGDSATDANKIIDGRGVAPGSTLRVIEALGQTLEQGSTIQMACGADTSLTIAVSGIEQT